MSKQQAKRQVELVEEYAANLAKLEAQAEANTAAILRRSLTGTLKDLRRAYGDFLDPELVAYADPTGQMVLRPGQYSAAQAAAKFRGLAEIAQGFMTPQELDTWERAFRVDLQRATVLGGELGHKLAEVVGEPRPGILRRFAGANRPAIEGAARQASAFIEGESAKFRQQLVQVVGDGVARGVGRGQMVQQVRMLLEGVDSTSKGLTKSIGTVQRARLIARSELANAYGRGARDLAMANGFGYVRWIATESERTCPVCVARHGQIYPVAQATFPAHPNCVLGDTKVSTGPIAAAFRSIYRGNVVTLRFENGESLTVTAQHPVLSPAGWVKAESVKVGDQLVGHGASVHGRSLVGPDLHEVPATAEDVFTAFSQSGAVSSVSVPVAPLHLHGDGAFIEGDVQVVSAQSLLHPCWVTEGGDGIAQGQGFSRRPSFVPFAGLGDADALTLGLNAAANGSVGRLREALALLSGGLSHADEHRIATTAWRDPVLVQDTVDRLPLDAELGGQGLDAHPLAVKADGGIVIEGDAARADRATGFGKSAVDDMVGASELMGEMLDLGSGLVTLNKVVGVEFNPFHGPVYTFETFSGAYCTGDTLRILNRNCRCTLVPVPNELVEEEDADIRDTLLDGDYWRESQAAVKDEYIRTANKTPAQADRILAAALVAPTASEKRVNPGISVGLQPSVPTDAPGGGGRSFEEAILAREQLVQQKQELEAQRLEAERARQEAEAAAKGQPWGAEVPPDVVIEHLGARAIEEWKQAGPAAREALYREAQRKKRKR